MAKADSALQSPTPQNPTALVPAAPPAPTPLALQFARCTSDATSGFPIEWAQAQVMMLSAALKGRYAFEDMADALTTASASIWRPRKRNL